MKKIKTGILRKVSGPSAKHFVYKNCGYIHTLWKALKITLDNLKTCSIKDIPTRIVQVAWNTYLSRLIAMLKFNIGTK